MALGMSLATKFIALYMSSWAFFFAASSSSHSYLIVFLLDLLFSRLVMVKGSGTVTLYLPLPPLGTMFCLYTNCSLSYRCIRHLISSGSSSWYRAVSALAVSMSWIANPLKIISSPGRNLPRFVKLTMKVSQVILSCL